jgi:hypothetical protein
VSLSRRCVAAVLLSAVFTICVGGISSSRAATLGRRLGAQLVSAANADSRLGMNLDDLASAGSVVFTDVMKQASPWSSDRALSLVDDGNVTRLAAQQTAQTVIFPYAPYPSGDYTLFYDGSGTLAVDPRSGSLSAVAPGRAIVHISARPGFGIRLILTATDPHNYMRNIRLILPGFESTYQNTPFAPAFVARLSAFNVLRFTQWSHGDRSALPLSWPMRPTLTQFTQAGPGGVAWEYQIALANAVGADPWFVVPAGATNFFVTQLAALIHSRLDPRLRPMIEYTDGAWRAGSPTNIYAAMAGRNFHLAADAQPAALSWYSLRSTQVFALVQEVFGADAGRIVRVLGGVPALAHSPAEALDRAIFTTAAAAQHADAFAVDTAAANPAAVAYTRSLLAGTRLELDASGGALSLTGVRDAAASTQHELAVWHASGGGLFVASSLTGYLSATGLLNRVSVATLAQIDALRAGALGAYAQLYPASHIVPRPLAVQSVLAPIAFPNSYLPSVPAAPAAGRKNSIALVKKSAAVPFASTAGIDIDAGGPAVAGTSWVTDVDYSGGAASGGTSATINTNNVSSPAPQKVYQTARYANTFSYVIPGLTPSANYTVRLHFAEYFWGAANSRLFNATINGAQVLSNFDIFAAAGGKNIAIVEAFTATATTAGTITIGFTTAKDHAEVGGIEIYSAGAPPTPTPPPPPTPTPGPAGDVTTYHNDTLRTGWNPTESILNPTTVASSKFGLRQTLAVDGLVMAQPLYVANYPVNGTNHNLLIVATEHDSVYAFDADSGAQLWRQSLGTPQATADVGCTDIQPEYGINSTPVIDRSSGTLYVVAASEPSSKVFVTQLLALDLAAGTNKVAPARIAASALESNGSTISFNDVKNMQRASILLANGSLYLGFGSHCDHSSGSASGWLMRYSASNLAKLAAVNTIEDGVSGGSTQLASIWGAGFGPAADAQGNIYAVTGNGAFDATSSAGHNFAMSVLRFAPDLSGGIRDWFAYSGEAADSGHDQDFGSGGAMLLPTQSGNVPNVLVAMGKSSNVYLLNGANLGKFSSNDAGALQIVSSGRPDGNGVWGGPAYFNVPGGGPTVYYQVDSGVMKAYRLSTGGSKPQLSVVSTGTTLSGYGGTIPVVTSNGQTAGTGVVWALRRVKQSGGSATTTLDAYDASNLGKHLAALPAGTWSQAGDNCFVAPLVANGKVYTGAYKTVFVFGLGP